MVYVLSGNGTRNVTRNGQLDDLRRDSGFSEADAIAKLQNAYQGQVVQILGYISSTRTLNVSVDGLFTQVNVDGLKRTRIAYFF